MKSNQTGFSLIELIIATSVMGVITAGVINITERQLTAIARMEDKLEKVEVERLVRESIADVTTCSSNFAGSKISTSKKTEYKLKNLSLPATATNPKSTVLFASKEKIGKIQLGQISFKNKNIAAKSSSGKITLSVPVSRLSNSGAKDFAPIEIDLNASVDSNFRISNCSSADIPSIDPSGHKRDGWLCTCNGDFTSDTEGGTTICMLEEAGRITDMWVAPDPWTKATSKNFNCNDGEAPNPPGSRPLLKWRYNDYAKVYERCNMTLGSSTVTRSCNSWLNFINAAKKKF